MIKKIIIFILTFTGILNMSIFVLGAENTVKSISINNDRTLYLTIDDYVTLNVKLNPSNASLDGLTFSSSYPRIADVDFRGNVTAKREGRTTITANLNGKKSSITVVVSEMNKSLNADFTVKDVSGTNFKEITITPCRYDKDNKIIKDEADDEYYIYLPSGYFIEGKNASYIADRNGVYPFTVYYANNRRTFYYTVDDIESIIINDDKVGSKTEDKDKISFDYKLMYDYEKKQIIFNMELDKVRHVVTPDKKVTVSNEINYYINALKNSAPFEFSIIVDNKKYEYKIVKQGEFYLLIALSPVDYDNYSSIVQYFGYNFTTNENFKAFPNKDIFYDNGNYEVLIQSDANTKEIFNFNISGIDFRRPYVNVSILDDSTFELNIKDDFCLDYIITYDGKYVPISPGKGNTTTFTYRHNAKISYNGDYVFTVVDKAGNRTIASATVDFGRNSRRYSVDYNIHNYKNIKDLFADIGLIYDYNDDDDSSSFEIIMPAYMSGSSSLYFKPDSPISRAEIITIFCRITDLPYDTGAFLKNKFTDIENHWARDYISMGSNKKYVKGYKDKTFRPDNDVTRAEFCEMLNSVSSFKAKLSAIPAASNYSNFVDINDHWANKEMIKIISRDIVTGKNNYFYPDKPITRGEVVHALNKLYGLNPSAGELKYIDSLYKKYYKFRDINNYMYYNDVIISVVGMYKEKIN